MPPNQNLTVAKEHSRGSLTEVVFIVIMYVVPVSFARNIWYCSDVQIAVMLNKVGFKSENPTLTCSKNSKFIFQFYHHYFAEY